MNNADRDKLLKGKKVGRLHWYTFSKNRMVITDKVAILKRVAKMPKKISICRFNAHKSLTSQSKTTNQKTTSPSAQENISPKINPTSINQPNIK